MTDCAMAAHTLGKRFGRTQAVESIDLAVRRGEVYGFIGCNGAGKTTTIRMLLGLIQPSSGHVALFGETLRPGKQRLLQRVGSLVEAATAYPNLTVRENLRLQQRLTRQDDAAVSRAIEALRLGKEADRLAGQLSLGNRQRLALARALLHRPELLILDEPTNALDPSGIVEIRALLRGLAKEHGVTVFLSSHILAEVAQIADRIGIVHAGKLLEEIRREDLGQRTQKLLEIDVSDPVRAHAVLRARFADARVERVEGSRLHVVDSIDRSAEMARVLVGEGLDLTHLCTRREDLEAYFLRRTTVAS